MRIVGSVPYAEQQWKMRELAAWWCDQIGVSQVMPESIRTGNVVDCWPAMLVPAVKLVGPELVWTCGLRVLGYPPTFISQKPEYQQVEAEIHKTLERNHVVADESEWNQR